MNKLGKIGKIWEFTKDILFPPLCADCGNFLNSTEKDDFLCERCFESIIINRNPLKNKEGETICAACDYRQTALRELIKILKYSGLPAAARPIAELMTEYFNISGLAKKLEADPMAVIIPVPLHYARKAKRGYNQAEEIAKIIGEKFRIPVVTNAIKRKYRTTQQSMIKDNNLRKRNTEGAFVRRRSFPTLAGFTAVIIDDVYTSGATMKEAESAVLAAGAKKTILCAAAFAGK